MVNEFFVQVQKVQNCNAIFEHRAELIECMVKIQNGNQSLKSTIPGDKKMLSDENYVFGYPSLINEAIC